MRNTPTHYERLADGRLGLRRFREAQAGMPNVVCFPFAGGQSLAFKPLADQLPINWGVWAIDPPGHGWCPGEPLVSVDEMVDLYRLELPTAVLRGAVLMGHSLGGCVAFAMADRLRSEGTPATALILSAARPPHRANDYESFLSMDDERLLRTLIQLGGIPAEWADEPELFDYFKEALRADFRAFESFRIDAPLDSLPVLAMGGRQDVVCRPEHVLEWSRYCPQCRVDFVSGEHTFLQTNPAPLAKRIVEFVAPLSARRPE